MPEEERAAVLATFSDEDLKWLEYDWDFHARPKQKVPPDDGWFIWMLLSGRGFGKNRAGGGWFHQRMMENPLRHGILIAKNPADARDDMIEGLGGILQNCPPWESPDYEPSKRKLTWPNGATARVRSGADPDGVRGFSGDTAWCDEFASWHYPRETLDNLLMGMREARVSEPRVCITTTPKPKKVLRELVADTVTVRTVVGSTYENLANLSPQFIAMVRKKYEGTTLGQQELWAALLDEMPGALWTRKKIDENRIQDVTKVPTLVRKVVAVDPAITSGEDAAEHGIQVCGLGVDAHGYQLADVSLRGTPMAWAKRAIEAFRIWGCDTIIAEKNQGGEMVKQTIHSVENNVPVKLVWASQDKAARAAPVASLAEQGLIHHVGVFEELEDQQCNWVPPQPGERQSSEDSPDRMDAHVHAFRELMVSGKPIEHVPPSFAAFERVSPWRR